MLGFWNNYISFNGMGVKASSLKYSSIGYTETNTCDRYEETEILNVAG